MKARIIDDMTEAKNIVVFNGKEYDLQMGMHSYAEIEKEFKGGMKEALESLGKLETVIKILTILLNEAIIVSNFENDLEDKLLPPEYVGARIPKDKFPEMTRAIGRAMGLSIGTADTEESELENALEKALDGEDFPAEEKN